MANAQNIQAKAAQVEEISKKIANAQSVIVFDYRGLNAEEVTNLRSDMRKAGVEYVVLKNHIVSRAAHAAGIDDSFHTMLKGPNAFAFGHEDAVAPAKVLKDAIKKYKKCEMKGGIINGVVTSLGLQPLPLIRTDGAVVLGMVYNYLPYMIMPLYTVLVKLDPRLTEAAEDLGCTPAQVFGQVTLPLSVPGIISGFTMVFVPAVSTFYISQKMGSAGTTLIGDVIESQFKAAYNPNLGAALSLVLMVMVLVCITVMNRFSDEEEVATI